MIYTVTLNPAVDRTILIKNFSLNHVNRAETVREDAGGKGINVSKMIKNLRGESKALGICAGNSGTFIQSQLKEMGIDHQFIQGEGQTRTNIKIVAEQNNTFTDINEAGRPVSHDTLKNIEELIFGQLVADDFLILAGSVPANVTKDIYQKWVQKANEIGAKVLLDADGELLEQGILAGPYLIKPNVHELEMLLQRKIETVNEIIDGARSLLSYGIKVVVVSRGHEGCVVVTEDEVLIIDGLSVQAKSTVGAGDSMVAALAYALDQGNSLKEAITLGVAASAASVMQEGTIMGDWETIQKLKQIVKFQERRLERSL